MYMGNTSMDEFIVYFHFGALVWNGFNVKCDANVRRPLSHIANSISLFYYIDIKTIPIIHDGEGYLKSFVPNLEFHKSAMAIFDCIVNGLLADKVYIAADIKWDM